MFVYRPDSPHASTPVEPKPFVPEVTVEGDIVRVDVTFPDGSAATLTSPAELDLAPRGLQPDVSYEWVDDPPPRFPILFLHGPDGVESDYVYGTQPEETFTSRDGGKVELWPAIETDYTTMREIGWWLVFRTPSWSVLVSLRDRADGESLASSLTLVEADTGLPVVGASGQVKSPSASARGRERC